MTRPQAALGERFARGVVLYAGDRAVPFGDRLAAWPLASLVPAPSGAPPALLA